MAARPVADGSHMSAVSRTVERDGTFPVPDCPGVIHAAAHRRHQDPLAG